MMIVFLESEEYIFRLADIEFIRKLDEKTCKALGHSLEDIGKYKVYLKQPHVISWLIISEEEMKILRLKMSYKENETRHFFL